MAYTPIEIPEVDYELAPPETVLGYPASQHTVDHSDGVTYFLGRGNRKNPSIMFVSSCPLEEELDSRFSPAMLLKGSPGALFERSARRAGIDVKSQYYTTLCKYALPRRKKLKPDKEDIERCAHLFERELKQRKPRVVVCLGKQVFDYFYNLKFQDKEIMGGWFNAPTHTIKTFSGEWSEDRVFNKDLDDYVIEQRPVMQDTECYRDFKLFVMGPPHVAVSKPEVLEGQAYDLYEIKRHLDFADEITEKVSTDYQLLDTVDKVETWTNRMLEDKRKLFSVDCEWAGEDFMIGELRSVQMCWAEGRASCLQFFNEDHKYTFTDEELKKVLGLFQKVMNQEDVRFIGHNFAADYLWMKHHLGVDPYKRCVFDTMYAMHTVDESYDLKLERLAIRFTDLGRYDIDLLIWKKQNKEKMRVDGGYGAIPTDILFPYSCADVDVPFRAYPKLLRLLQHDDTMMFYYQLKLPYVTDGFAHMTETGVPLDAEDAERVRKNYTMMGQLMLDTFRKRVREQADTWLLSMLVTEIEDIEVAQDLYKVSLKGDTFTHLKEPLGAKKFAENAAKLSHWQDARRFNPNSVDQKRCWLFDFKGFEPLKSTSNDDGPSISWDKVLELSPGRQKNYNPSADKDVLTIYAQEDDDCQLLIEQMAVAQVTKNFLKGTEAGIQACIREDGRVHTSFLCTETNRPKSIHPNILNLPGYLNARVEAGMKRSQAFLCEVFATDDVNEAYAQYLKTLKGDERVDMPDNFEDLVPVRWCFKAPKDWCFVDADYATAEVWSLAYLAADKHLIKRLTSHDPQFVVTRDAQGNEGLQRIAYVEGVTPFDEEQWDMSLVKTLEELGDTVVRDKDGNPIHPKRDIHWEMAEHRLFMNMPREKMSKSRERAAGKVGNFQIPYQASPGLLDRLIEVNTGVKPEAGTGERIIEAYKESNPQCWEFLEETMNKVGDAGFYQSPFGCKRHFKTHQGNEGVSRWKKDSVLSGLRRQASNYPMQSLVACYLARAIVELIDAYRREGLKAGVCTPLYDAIYTACPTNERVRVKELMQKYMADANFKDLKGGRLSFSLDFAITKRWSVEPTEEESKELFT